MTLEKILLDEFKKEKVLTRERLVEIGKSNNHRYYYNTSVDSTLRAMVRNKQIAVLEKRKAFVYSYKLIDYYVAPQTSVATIEDDTDDKFKRLIKDFRPGWDDKSRRIRELTGKIQIKSLKPNHDKYKKQVIFLIENL